MSNFEVTANFKGKSLAAGNFDAEKPIDAIIAARQLRGRQLAKKLGCQEEEINWEAEENFF